MSDEHWNCSEALDAAQARIAELEANEAVYERILGGRSYQQVADAIAELEAERDKLKAAQSNADSQLIAALQAHAWGECLGYIHSARAALSVPSGE